jgi:hypothetical protein
MGFLMFFSGWFRILLGRWSNLEAIKEKEKQERAISLV